MAPAGTTISQVGPVAAKVVTSGSGADTAQSRDQRGHDALTFTWLTETAGLQVASTGVVSTTGLLPVGVYTATGVDAAGGDSGTWSFELDVVAGTSSVPDCDQTDRTPRARAPCS